MHLRTVFLGNMLLLAAPALATAGQPESVSVTGRDDKRLAPLDRLMTGFVSRHKLPGASLAVVRHGRLVYARGFGLADRESGEVVEPTSLFRIASLSKPVTSLVLLRAAEADMEIHCEGTRKWWNGMS